MAPANPYQTLGVNFGASKEEVTSAYRRLAKKMHPDANPGDTLAAGRFQELRKAYEEVLAQLPGSSMPRPSSEPAARRRKDKTRTVAITVAQAMTGAKITLKGVSGRCAPCGGSGTVRGPSAACPVCKGTGVSASISRGFMSVRAECSNCRGTGRTTRVECGDCGGSGAGHETDVVIDVPPCTDGSVFVVPGGAEDRRAGTYGDLMVRVAVEDPSFRIDGEDVVTQVPLHFWQTALGCSAEVVAPDGRRYKLKVPASTPHGTAFRLRGKGMNRTEARGDLVAVVTVRTLDPEKPGVRAALEQLARAAGDVSPAT